MTKKRLADFRGGAIGSHPTRETEPWAIADGGPPGNMTYQAAIPGTSGQSVEVSGARDFVWATPGPRWRIGMWVQWVSGTQTAGLAVLLLRSGTTNRGDVFLRNQNGGQIALRAGVGGTTYAGQSAVSMARGDTWWVELEYDSLSMTAHLWRPGNTTITPDETFWGTVAAPVDNVRLFNPTGTTGLTMRFGDVWTSDGEQIRGEMSEGGTLDFLSNFSFDDAQIIASAKVSGAGSVRLAFDGSAGAVVAPDARGYARVTAPAVLRGDARPWELFVDGVSRATGTLAVPPSSGEVRFVWGSCIDTPSSAVYGKILARRPHFAVVLGDWPNYDWITGGRHGNTSPSDAASIYAVKEVDLAATGTRTLTQTVPLHYTYSDADGAGANADGTTGGHATGAVQEVYRTVFAHPDLPLARSGARSWVIGRVRFVQTDETADAAVRTMTDGAAKSKLGAEQKSWFLSEIAAAKAAGQAVIWFGDGPWVEPTGAPGASATYNSWARYNTERTELGTRIAASGVRLVRLHGDTHSLFYDDGTNNRAWGGFPTASAAPFHTTAQRFGYAVSGGSYPTSGSIDGAQQYGFARIVDDGTRFELELSGFSSTAAEPREVERFRAVIDLDEQARG